MISVLDRLAPFWHALVAYRASRAMVLCIVQFQERKKLNWNFQADWLVGGIQTKNLSVGGVWMFFRTTKINYNVFFRRCSQAKIPMAGIKINKHKTGINKSKADKLNILCDICDAGQTFKAFRRICWTYWGMERLGSRH